MAAPFRYVIKYRNLFFFEIVKRIKIGEILLKEQKVDTLFLHFVILKSIII